MEDVVTCVKVEMSGVCLSICLSLSLLTAWEKSHVALGYAHHDNTIIVLFTKHPATKPQSKTHHHRDLRKTAAAHHQIPKSPLCTKTNHSARLELRRAAKKADPCSW